MIMLKCGFFIFALLFCTLPPFMQCNPNIVIKKYESKNNQNVSFMMSGYDSLTNKIWIILGFQNGFRDERIMYNYINTHIFEYDGHRWLTFREYQWPFNDTYKLWSIFNKKAIINPDFSAGILWRELYQGKYVTVQHSIYYEDQLWRGSYLKSISMRSHQMTIVKYYDYALSPNRPTCFTKSIDQKYFYFFSSDGGFMYATIVVIDSTDFNIYWQNDHKDQELLPTKHEIENCLVASDNYLYAVDTKNDLFRINVIYNDNFSNDKWKHIGRVNHNNRHSYVTELNGYIYIIAGFIYNKTNGKYRKYRSYFYNSYHRSNVIQYLPLKSLKQNETNNVTFFERKVDIIPFVTGVTSNDSIYLFGRKEFDKPGGCCFDLVQVISFEREKEENSINKKNIYHTTYIIDHDHAMIEIELQSYIYGSLMVLFVIMCVIGYGYKRYKHSFRNYKSI